MTDALETTIQNVSRDLAFDDWDNIHGSGLYHAHQNVQDAEVARARKTVENWVKKLESGIRADERAKIAEMLDDDKVYYKIDDQWGSSGVAARDFIVKKLQK
jgi:RNA binding exosome subunit